MLEKINKSSRVEYWVDGKKIGASHFAYSVKKIGLDEFEGVTIENVSDAYKNRFNELFELSRTQKIRNDIFSISTAKSYLLDRCDYLGTSN